MAIYSTFFLARPDDLLGAFPGWRLPLPEPVTRTFMHPFLKREVTVTTREPDWSDLETDINAMPEIGVVAVQGDYGEYLESRIPAFVGAQPHWCTKGLTMVELQPLVGILEGPDAQKLESALYAPPPIGAGLLDIPTKVSMQLGNIDRDGLVEIAAQWAASMSTPEHTHSAAGYRISDGWPTGLALQYVSPIANLATQTDERQQMYLLFEG